MFTNRIKFSVSFFCLRVFALTLLSVGFLTAGETRNAADTLSELEKLTKSNKLSYEELRTVRESLENIRAAQKLRDRQTQRKEAEVTLQKLLCEAADASPSDRISNLAAARLLLSQGQADIALKYLTHAQAASTDDIEWPLLCTQAYIQLGDFEKAAIYSAQVDSLLQNRSVLQLSKPILVDEVTGYRLYTPAKSVKIASGDRLTLYVEISGAKFSPAAGGARCTLDFSLELRDAFQNVIDSNENYGRYDPIYNGPVRDLHATIYYRLPDHLDPGRYVLLLRCRDALGQDTKAQTEYTLTIGAAAGRPTVPGDTEEAAKAKAVRYVEQMQSGKLTDLIKEIQDPDANPVKVLDTPAKIKEPTEAQKMGQKLLLDQSTRAGDAVSK